MVRVHKHFKLQTLESIFLWQGLISSCCGYLNFILHLSYLQSFNELNDTTSHGGLKTSWVPEGPKLMLINNTHPLKDREKVFRTYHVKEINVQRRMDFALLKHRKKKIKQVGHF